MDKLNDIRTFIHDRRMRSANDGAIDMFGFLDFGIFYHIRRLFRG